jgi:HEAT repeat protein
MKRLAILVLLLTGAGLLAPAAADEYLGKNASKWLLELKTVRDLRAKRSAIFALGKLGLESADALPTMAELLTHADANIREAAATSIGQIVPRGRADTDLLDKLCKLAQSDRDARVRSSAIVALGRCARDDSPVRSALEQCMNDAEAVVRQNAGWALGEVCERTDAVPVDTLRKGLQDGDKLVKRDAAAALGKILNYQGTFNDEGEPTDNGRGAKLKKQCKSAIRDLIECVEHDYLELRKSACRTLINLVDSNSSDAVSALAKACRDADFEVRANGALALANIGGKGSQAAVPVLVEVLRKGESDMKRMAAIAFRGLGGEAQPAIPELVDMLKKEPDRKVRYYIALAMGNLKDQGAGAIAGLAARVADSAEDVDVRVASAMSMQLIGVATGPTPAAVNATPALIKVVDDPKQPAKVRERILWALRVHKGGLAEYDELFTALKKILVEKELGSAGRTGKMLRYDAAFLTGVFKATEVPNEVFPVLLAFLKDNDVKLYTGISVSGNKGGISEGGKAGGNATVTEEGSRDGRWMPIEALRRIGAGRIREHPEIIDQLRVLRGDASIDDDVRQGAKEILAELGVK